MSSSSSDEFDKVMNEVNVSFNLGDKVSSSSSDDAKKKDKHGGGHHVNAELDIGIGNLSLKVEEKGGHHDDKHEHHDHGSHGLTLEDHLSNTQEHHHDKNKEHDHGDHHTHTHTEHHHTSGHDDHDVQSKTFKHFSIPESPLEEKVGIYY